MRRAFRIDPSSLQSLQLENSGRLMIDQVMGQYSTEGNIPNTDQAFMLSALHYLKHDYVQAKKSIAGAQLNGDQSSSIENLKKLVDERMEGQKN